MRVALMTAGSRGDVAPYTGLGHGLAAAGHRVTLVTHARFAPLAADAGIGFRPLPVDPRAELASARGQGLHRSRGGAAKFARVVAMARGLVGEMADGLLDAAQDQDVLLVSGSLGPLGHTIGAGLGRPTVGVYLQPLAATAEFGPPVLGARGYGAAGNLLAGRVVGAAVDAIFADTVRRLRTRLGLPPSRTRAARRARERQDWPVLHGFSELVVPRPRDWRPGLRVAGYWWPYCPPAGRLPCRVEEFLAAGPAPVFVGLGSATVPDPDRLSRELVAALRAAGLRGVMQRGWSDLAADGEDMLTVDELPHGLLFPRMAAVVHHAGAGTTAAALRAGVPAVPLPVQFDAGFWADRLVGLGVAPTAIPLRRLASPSLAAALRRVVDDPGYRRRAAALAAGLRAEDGVGPVLSALDGIADA
ncbi:glycosyltransferase [Kitasatospora paracochleata]|uniref:UDP:flavonoid glycosyltransferase YjiC (YdhE family) n=1 Tax=Kitasatospora paracochleata TaxID=58354 RepID=A0ABT1J907_9ACTN|nr:glycosyltransferase [Kitasatospora paracochleata]MCP2313573.1 UDP:flavonoid glycosyltransferase YjiC (YdhE family) [Kitasatospora paracochleata]